jgi:proteasome activator subunit 4
MSMSLPIADGLTRLSLRDAGPGSNGTTPRIPEDILQGSSDRTLQKLQNYAHSLPYAIEDNARMQRMLDFFILRIVQCVEAKDFDPGLLQWDSMLTQYAYCP